MAKMEKNSEVCMLSVAFSQEKLDAVDHYLKEKGENFQQTLVGFLEKTYRRAVPLPVREYLSAKENGFQEPATEAPESEQGRAGTSGIGGPQPPRSG